MRAAEEHGWVVIEEQATVEQATKEQGHRRTTGHRRTQINTDSTDEVGFSPVFICVFLWL
jgi:hypothetical protein